MAFIWYNTLMSRTKKGYLGENNPNWKGGDTKPRCSSCEKQIAYGAKTCLDHRPHKDRKKIMHNGYYMIYKPEHLLAGGHGYIKEHRWIMEQSIGRILNREELVHHINHIKTDNRIENLMIISRSKHSSHHSQGIIIPNYQKKIISKAHKGNKYWLGKKHTEETKKKMSKSAKLIWEDRRLD